MNRCFAAAATAILVLAAALPNPAAAGNDGKIWMDPDPAKMKPAVVVPSLAPLGKALKPTVVSIWMTQTIDPEKIDPMFKLFKEFFGTIPEAFQNRGEGSGVIINPEGYILTNNHVVENATDIRVTTASGDEYEATIIGIDPATDIALVKIAAKDLSAAPLGDSDSLAVGDWVVAIGNPFGLEATMTAGIVSAKGRRHIGPVEENIYQDFIQTDAPINPGSSGGPLFDLAGNVVGINTAINAAGQGIGFAIPINMIKPLIPQLVKDGKVSRSWLGVSIQTVTGPLAQGFGLPDGPTGALVSEVVDGSPADKAGVAVGDIILDFDGTLIESVESLSWIASTAGQGKKVAIVVWRKGQKKSLEATLGTLPGSEAGPPAEVKKPEKGKKKSDPGVTLQGIDPETATRLGIAPVDGKYPGLLVTSIQPTSPLAASGIQRGDVILQVGGKLVYKPENVTGPIKKAKKGDVVVLYVLSPEEKGFVAYTP